MQTEKHIRTYYYVNGPAENNMWLFILLSIPTIIIFNSGFVTIAKNYTN